MDDSWTRTTMGLSRWAALAPLLVALGITGCGGGAQAIDSQSTRPGEIDIDGSRGDWSGALQPMEDGDLWIGAKNDGKYLYVTLATDQRQMIQQILVAGMTLWINTTGEKEQTFGIRFPVGTGAGGFDPSLLTLDPSVQDPAQDAVILESLLAASTSHAELIVGNDTIRVDQPNSTSMKAAVALDDALVYELQLALVRDAETPYGIGASPGDTLVVGFTTPELDREAMREQMAAGSGGMGGGRPGGSGGGRQGGMGGGRQGGTGGGRPSMPEPLDTWVEIALTGQTE